MTPIALLAGPLKTITKQYDLFQGPVIDLREVKEFARPRLQDQLVPAASAPVLDPVHDPSRHNLAGILRGDDADTVPGEQIFKRPLLVRVAPLSGGRRAHLGLLWPDEVRADAGTVSAAGRRPLHGMFPSRFTLAKYSPGAPAWFPSGRGDGGGRRGRGGPVLLPCRATHGHGGLGGGAHPRRARRYNDYILCRLVKVRVMTCPRGSMRKRPLVSVAPDRSEHGARTLTAAPSHRSGSPAASPRVRSPGF